MTIDRGTTGGAGLTPGSPADILRRAAAVPCYDRFPELDDLLAAFDAVQAANPDLVGKRRIGTSRLGEPIHAYMVGDGTLNNLIIGGVHPNEPIGSWTALRLLTELAEDAPMREAFRARWHIVPSIDPDGYRLNEGWMDDPADRVHYARHFYRPAGDEQMEWTFPFSYKSIYFDAMPPETVALMRLMDATKPDFYISLHNAEMGGVYYYLNEEIPELIELLHAIPASLGLPLDKGEPESGDLELMADAVYKEFDLEKTYDWLESLGIDLVTMKEHSGGDSSASHLKQYGTLCLIAELPYWSHPDADDTTPADETYAAVLERTGVLHEETGRILKEVLDEAAPYLKIDGPLRRAAAAFGPGVADTGKTARARSQEAASQRPATVAERFGCEDSVHMFRLRFGSMTLQSLQAECQAGIAPAPLRRVAKKMADVFEQWAADAQADDRSQPIPLGKAVGVQYGAVLAGAAVRARLLAP